MTACTTAKSLRSADAQSPQGPPSGNRRSESGAVVLSAVQARQLLKEDTSRDYLHSAVSCLYVFLKRDAILCNGRRIYMCDGKPASLNIALKAALL